VKERIKKVYAGERKESKDKETIARIKKVNAGGNKENKDKVAIVSIDKGYLSEREESHGK